MPPRLLARLSLAFALTTTIALFPEAFAAEGVPAPAGSPSAERQAQFKEIEAEFARFEQTLAGVTDVHFVGVTRQVLDLLRQRVFVLRSKFDQGRYDEVRFELNAEYQRLARWLAAPILSVPTVDSSGVPINTLSEAERTAGWELLFDGTSFAGWRGYRLATPPASGWEVRDGVLRTSGGAPTGVDLITDRRFTNFELAWEWRVAPGANGGLKYFVTEDRPSAPGHEYQILDDEGDPVRAWRGEVHRTAAFYDVVPPIPGKSMRPAGEWNHSRLIVAGRRVEHWLNGMNVVTYELGDERVKRGMARSKFKAEPGFGEKIAGHLLITYHPTETWYRNLKVRELK
jgi:hypothetical protein